jgi:hypothetical protein
VAHHSRSLGNGKGRRGGRHSWPFGNCEGLGRHGVVIPDRSGTAILEGLVRHQDGLTIPDRLGMVMGLRGTRRGSPFLIIRANRLGQHGGSPSGKMSLCDSPIVRVAMSLGDMGWLTIRNRAGTARALGQRGGSFYGQGLSNKGWLTIPDRLGMGTWATSGGAHPS